VYSKVFCLLQHQSHHASKGDSVEQCTAYFCIAFSVIVLQESMTLMMVAGAIPIFLVMFFACYGEPTVEKRT